MKNVNAPSGHTDDIEADKYQIIEDGLGEHLEQGCLPVDARPPLEDQRSSLSPIQNSATEVKSDNISTTCQVSLSQSHSLNTLLNYIPGSRFFRHLSPSEMNH